MKRSDARIEYLDVARAVAAILVTWMHALTRSFNTSSGSQIEFYSIPLLMTIIKGVIYGVSRLSVCFFVLITGVLLLPRNYAETGTLKRFIKHNWLNLFITTEIWLIIMFWYKQVLPGSILLNKGLANCLFRFIATICFIYPVTMETMWYMPMILCLYLLVPIFSEALKRIPHKFFLIPCGFIVFDSFILPVMNGILVGMGSSIQLESTLGSGYLFSVYAVYLLAGFFIGEGYLDKMKTKSLVIIGIASIAVLCALQIWVWSTAYEYKFGFAEKDLFLLISSICFFELLRRTPISPALASISGKLAEISFGIYFVHICIVVGLNTILTRCAPNIVYFNKFLILVTASFFGSVLIIQVVRRNKILAKFLFGIRS